LFESLDGYGENDFEEKKKDHVEKIGV